MDNFRPTIFDFQHPWATDLPQQTRELKYLLRAENLIHDVGGQTRKVGGTLKINATVISGAPSITGMFDFWRAGTAGTFAQKFVCVTSDGKVYKEDMDGTFDDITGAASIATNAIPVFCQARDLLLIFFNTNSTPLKWNQTGNVATLGGSPPAGRGAVFHVNRVWTWGDVANPSRLTYGSSTSAEDFTGGDTGAIDIDPEDGDIIVGAVAHKSRLIIFKGPNKGSIHIISGTAPTGGDAFSRTVLVRGIPLQSHNSIVEFGDDIYFMSDRGIHSLAATDKFGNFAGSDITRHLKTFFRDQINRLNLSKVWGVDFSAKSCLVWTIQSSNGTGIDTVFGLSYARLLEKGTFLPFIWNRGCVSAAMRIHPTTKIPELIFGGDDGFARRQDMSNRSIDGSTAYTLKITTPELILGTSDTQGKPRGDQPIVLERLYVRSVETGDYDVNVAVTRDRNPPESYTFNQGMSNFTLDISTLDTDSMGGGSLIQYSDPKIIGSARTVQFELTQGGLEQGANLLEMGIDWLPEDQSDVSTL